MEFGPNRIHYIQGVLENVEHPWFFFLLYYQTRLKYSYYFCKLGSSNDLVLLGELEKHVNTTGTC